MTTGPFALKVVVEMEEDVPNSPTGARQVDAQRI